MTQQLKTKSGITLFTAVLAPVAGVELHKDGEAIVAVKDGVVIGEVETAKTFVAPGTKGKSAAVKLEELIADIDVSSLIGKDPTTLTHEELIALTLHLQSGAAAQVVDEEDEEDDEEEEVVAPKPKAKKKPAPAPVVEDEEDEDEEDEEEDAFELPEGLDTYEAIAALGVKAMWAEIGKHIAAEAGIKARTPKDEMLEAIAEHFGLELEEDAEEEEVVAKPAPKGKKKPAPVVEEDEDDEDDIDEDEFEDEDEDEDDFDEDEEEEDEEDDEEFEDEDEDEDDEEEDEVTEEDVDALFETGNKQAIVAFCKQYNITLPKKKMNANTIKQIIKDALFGEE